MLHFHRWTLMLCLPQLEPDFEGAARDLKDEGVTLAKVNGMVEKDLFKEYEITGYPTLMVGASCCLTEGSVCKICQ